MRRRDYSGNVFSQADYHYSDIVVYKITFDHKEYGLLQYPGSGNSLEGTAVCMSDVIEENNLLPLYRFEWEVSDEYEEWMPFEWSCNWEHPVRAVRLKEKFSLNMFCSVEDPCRREEVVRNMDLADDKLKPEIIENYFRYLRDDELRDFEELTEGNEPFGVPAQLALKKLINAGYVVRTPDKHYVVCEEVKKVYQSIQSKEFEEKRQKYSYLYSCLEASGTLYGIMPLKILMWMLRWNPYIKMTQEEVAEGVVGLPPEYRDYVIKNDHIYHISFPDTTDLCLKEQGDKPFYIPDMSEVEDIAKCGCLPRRAEFKKLRKYLMSVGDMTYGMAGYHSMMIQKSFCAGYAVCDVIEYLEAVDAYFEHLKVDFNGDQKYAELTELLKYVQENTRMLCHRGYTPAEIKKE